LQPSKIGCGRLVASAHKCFRISPGYLLRPPNRYKAKVHVQPEGFH
jgi:hypothetical protein